MMINELVELCEIVDAGNGQLAIKNVFQGKKHLDEIKSSKPEILIYLAEKKAAEETSRREREAKINSIKGLKELQNAIDDEENYHCEFNRRMESESLSGILPTPPKANSDELRIKYPRAAAYIKAENWKYANHYAKSAAGEKALERIINGEDYAQVLAEMEAEWSAHCEEHIWD
jgi:hypothetical protein